MEEKNNRTKNNKIYASELDFDVVRHNIIMNIIAEK